MISLRHITHRNSLLGYGKFLRENPEIVYEPTLSGIYI